MAGSIEGEWATWRLLICSARQIEYLALTAATHGRLRETLEQPEVPAEDLTAAGEIIAAMITADAGPAPGMNAYADAASTCQLYLSHISRVPGDLLHLECAQQILRYVEADERDPAERLAQGWSDAARTEVVKLARACIGSHDWTVLIREQLGSNDVRVFERASRAAQQAGIDAYEWHWRRVCAMPRSPIAWFYATEGANSQRIDQLLQLAQRELPLAQLAAGPAARVIDPALSEVHTCLELVLQRLRDFPGKGMRLIAAGLRSPLVSNRNMAINALAATDVNMLSAEALAMIQRALLEETNPEIRVRLRALRERL